MTTQQTTRVLEGVKVGDMIAVDVFNYKVGASDWQFDRAELVTKVSAKRVFVSRADLRFGGRGYAINTGFGFGGSGGRGRKLTEADRLELSTRAHERATAKAKADAEQAARKADPHWVDADFIVSFFSPLTEDDVKAKLPADACRRIASIIKEHCP